MKNNANIFLALSHQLQGLIHGRLWFQVCFAGILVGVLLGPAVGLVSLHRQLAGVPRATIPAGHPDDRNSTHFRVGWSWTDGQRNA